MKTLVVLMVGLFIASFVAAGPVVVNHAIGTPAQIDHDGSNWDMLTGACPYTIVPGGQWSAHLGDKFPAMNVPPGNYSVIVTVVAKHNPDGGLAAIGGVELSHNETGGINTGPDFLLVGSNWTSVSFSASQTFTAEQLNSGGIRSSIRAYSGSDVDSVRIDVASVTIYAALAR